MVITSAPYVSLTPKMCVAHHDPAVFERLSCGGGEMDGRYYNRYKSSHHLPFNANFPATVEPILVLTRDQGVTSFQFLPYVLLSGLPALLIDSPRSNYHV